MLTKHLLVEASLFIVVNIGLSTTLVSLGLHYLAATIFGIAAHGVTAFFVKRRWVFDPERAPQTLPSLMKIAIMEVVVAGVVLCCVWFGTEFAHLPYLYARLLASLVAWLTIYSLDRLWIFKQ